MTDFLESVRPVESLPLAESDLPTEVVDLSVRQLLAELAHLEDVLRTKGGPASLDDAEVLATMAREQAIIDELHRRKPEQAPLPDRTDHQVGRNADRN